MNTLSLDRQITVISAPCSANLGTDALLGLHDRAGRRGYVCMRFGSDAGRISALAQSDGLPLVLTAATSP